jgi:hypothetical protein
MSISEYKCNGGYQPGVSAAPKPTGNAVSPSLLLPGAFLMAMRAQLLAPLMFVNFRFPTLF